MQVKILTESKLEQNLLFRHLRFLLKGAWWRCFATAVEETTEVVAVVDVGCSGVDAAGNTARLSSPKSCDPSVVLYVRVISVKSVKFTD